MKMNEEENKIMIERFGKDSIISLATTCKGVPHVTVSTWLEEMKLLIHTCASNRELVH